MTETIDGDFTIKHKRLLNIADVASIFAWLALVSFIFAALSKGFKIIIPAEFQLSPITFKDNPIPWISSFFEMIHYLLRGATCWLVLKGISLGLKMIVETDLNYRLQSEGGEDEQPAL